MWHHHQDVGRMQLDKIFQEFKSISRVKF
ncbi:MAG: HNH endonuclease [Puniceicoccales bacterium]|nr:HNH endonuclease [Puniceicoccales bacterium]